MAAIQGGMTLVVTLGSGTILRPGQRGSAAEQAENLDATGRELAQLVAAGYRLVVTHGNGPQVGNIVLQNEEARALVPPMPLDVCGAESQGQIGLLIQNTLDTALYRAGIRRPVVCLLTRVLVDPADPTFHAPTKVVGPVYSAAKAYELTRRGYVLQRDARGWRHVVPSPEPRTVCESPQVRSLLDAGCVVIAAGGGGAPVVREPDGRLRGVEAVVEKDLAASLLAVEIAADMLVFLTGVPHVIARWGQDGETGLRRLSVAGARRLVASGDLPYGSIGVKVEAAARFAERRQRPALITDLSTLGRALAGEGGTVIEP